MESPLRHFEVHTLVSIHIGDLDLSISNAVVAMWVGLAVIGAMFVLPARGGFPLIPGKLQSVLEVAVEFIRSLVCEFIGEEEGSKYVPFIASLFLFVLACNLIGLLPGSYAITSQLAVTGVFAAGIFIMTLVIGFLKHGMRFLGILVPPGIPKILIPVMIPIEIISMLARPISLAVRLFANMTAGHTVLAVLFGLAMTGPLWLGWLPFGFTVIINGLEIAIAFIQAYIFTTLTCVYIGDVIKLH